MNNTSNFKAKSGDTQPFYSFPAAFELPVLTCYVIIVVVAIVGNLMVCYAIMVDRNLRNNPTMLLLFSLALSDLLTVTTLGPLDIELFFLRGVWVHGELMCEIFSIMFLTTVPTSIWTLFAISIERYKSLSDPLNCFRRSPFMTRKRALITIVFIWVYSGFFSSIPSMGWRDAPGESVVKNGVCWYPYTLVYSMLTAFLNIVLPLLLSCGINIKIFRIASGRNKAALVHGKPAFIKENKTYLGNFQIAKTISMFVAVFFFCWFPYAMYLILSSLCDNCYKVIPEEAFPFLLMCGYLNSALNPFLFSLRNKSFKATYSKLLNSALPKPSRNARLGRRSATLSELTFTSEIPVLSDGDVQLTWIRTNQDEFPNENALQDTRV